MHLSRIVEDLARTDGGAILAALVRLTGDLDAAEDALQEGYARALTAWRREGVPERPAAWLNTVSRRIAIDRIRRSRGVELPDDLEAEPAAFETIDPSGVEDDRLRLLFVCCHPALAPEARCALALRTLGGLTTREIARAFVEPESTTAQRLVRAKKKIREARIPYEVPPREKLPERIDTVLAVIYFIFNEGYAATEGSSLVRVDLGREAIRLARLAAEVLPSVSEARGLLALLLLTDARRAARVTEAGDLVPLEGQDRSLWDAAQIREGVALIDETLLRGEPGPYQVQAAIAALHATAPAAERTDWPQIAALYRTLWRWMPTPVVALNAAVAEAMAGDLERGVIALEAIETSGALARYHLLAASKAELLRRLDRRDEAARAYRTAIELVTNPAERRYLEQRLRNL